MKKFLMLLTSFTLLVALVLSGCDCSCSSTPNLTFKSSFFGGEKAKQGYKETLTYSVNYDGDAQSYPELTKSAQTDGYIEKSGISYEGELITTLEIGNTTDVPADVASDILSEENVSTERISNVYVYKTQLNIKASYTFKDSQTPIVVNDKIETEVYFLPEGYSFAPIYSKYFADMHLLTIASETKVSRVQYDYKTTYNIDEFIMTKSVTRLDQNGEILDNEVDELEEEYSYKKAIDNNSLLFALRNYATDVEQTASLSVISPAYGEDKSLLLSAHVLADASIDFMSGVPTDEKLPVKNFSMNVNEKNAQGTSHYFTVQTGASASVANKALLVKFAQPILDYNTTSCLGALEFKLSSAVFEG